jgi:hypothetical protein
MNISMCQANTFFHFTLKPFGALLPLAPEMLSLMSKNAIPGAGDGILFGRQPKKGCKLNDF